MKYVLLANLILSQFAYCKTNTIVWAKFDLPGAFEIRGDQKGQGYMEKIISFIQKNIKNTVHKESYRPFARVLLEIKKGKNICTPLIYALDREADMAFSNPFIIVPAPKIYVAKSHSSFIQKFTIDKEKSRVSLELLLTKQNKLVLGLESNRLYSPDIFKVITKHKEKIVFRASAENPSNLFKMLNANRINMMIEYPEVMRRVMKKLNSNLPLAQFKMKEIDDYIVAHFACPKTPWGKDVLKQINISVTKGTASGTFFNYVENWLPPLEIPDYRKQTKKFQKKYYPNL